MIKCKYCGKREEDNKGYISLQCNDCIPDKEIGLGCLPHFTETENLEGYGRVEKSRLREMDRRKILPYSAPDGGYYVGRKGENGKIQEKEPTY